MLVLRRLRMMPPGRFSMIRVPSAIRTEREIVDAEASHDRRHRDRDGFDADRLDERVEDLGEHARAQPGAADLVRVAGHTLLPRVAHVLHGGDAGAALASVLLELVRADGHFGEDFRGFHHGAFVDVGADGGEDAVEDVQEDGGEDAV